MDKMHNLTDTLEHNGLVLLPTNSVWCMSCALSSEIGLKKLLTMKNDRSEYPITILVNSLDMVKQYFPHIHPRIETLLLYFERPLSIVYDTARSNLPDYIKQLYSTITFRMTLDPFCQKLIDLMDEAIIVSAAKTSPNSFPSSFQQIDGDIIRNMDYICQHRSFDSGFIPEVIISYDTNGELSFLRE